MSVQRTGLEPVALKRKPAEPASPEVSNSTSNDDGRTRESHQVTENANQFRTNLSRDKTQTREEIKVPLQQTRSALGGLISISVRIIYSSGKIDGVIGSKEAPDLAIDYDGVGESVIYREKFKIRIIEVHDQGKQGYVRFEVNRL